VTEVIVPVIVSFLPITTKTVIFFCLLVFNKKYFEEQAFHPGFVLKPIQFFSQKHGSTLTCSSKELKGVYLPSPP